MIENKNNNFTLAILELGLKNYINLKELIKKWQATKEHQEICNEINKKNNTEINEEEKIKFLFNLYEQGLTLVYINDKYNQGKNITHKLKTVFGIEKYNEAQAKYTFIQRKRITTQHESQDIRDKLNRYKLKISDLYPDFTEAELREYDLTTEKIMEIKAAEKNNSLNQLCFQYKLDLQTIKRIIYNA